MDKNSIFSFKNIATMIVFGLVVMIFTLAITAMQTPLYKSSAKLLVIFNQNNLDIYTASKTSNYITGILSEVIYSDSFIASVFSINSDLKNNLGDNRANRQKNWKKIVNVATQENNGIIMINVFGNDSKQIKQLAETIATILIQQHGLYDGSDSRVIIKAIDWPFVYTDWAITQIVRNTLIGLLAGLLIGLTLIILLPDQKLYLIFTYPWSRLAEQDETLKLFREINNEKKIISAFKTAEQAEYFSIQEEILVPVNKQATQENNQLLTPNNGLIPEEAEENLHDENWLYQYYQKESNLPLNKNSN